MLEFLNLNRGNDAIALIKKDHNTVQSLFTDFEHATTRAEKRALVAKIIEELKLHAEVEEKLFYARVRAELDKQVMTEADEEHHVAKILIAELEQMDGSEEHYDAKVMVLAENIRHHIREEEGRMLPKAHGLDLDFEAIGEEMQRQKDKLLKNGFPVSAEEKMVGKNVLKNDSPARTATRNKAASSKAKPKSAPTKSRVSKATVKGPVKATASRKVAVKATSVANRNAKSSTASSQKKSASKSAKR